MKAFILKKIADKIKKGKFIKRAIRVDDNVILLQIDKDRYYFDMTKSNSDIYINVDYNLSKKFSAPFDIVLAKKFIKSKIKDVKVKERILTIEVETNLKFKSEINTIQFEFTGRHTNVIILDESNTILEALHHIGEYNSFRVVQPNLKLTPLPDYEVKEKVFEVDDLEKYTQKLFNKKQQQRLNQIKNSIISKLSKKEKKIQKILDNLEDESELFQKSEKFKSYADILMVNLNKIKPYQDEIELEDFDGNLIKIPLPNIHNLNEVGNYYYNLSKKAKNKAKNIKIERDNLKSKIEFLQNYKKAVLNTQNIGELNLYKESKKREIKSDNVEQFFVDDFKVLVGKNEKGNIELLKNSKSTDVWMHIKDKTGAHVIIQTNKKSVPIEVLYQGAKFAVIFSNQEEGKVDFTKRKNVKVKDGAFVNYVEYDTFTITNRNVKQEDDDVTIKKV